MEIYFWKIPTMNPKTRKARVAGRFYPAYEHQIVELFQKMLLEGKTTFDGAEDCEIIGGIVPHAGYAFSGKVALQFFEYLSLVGFSFDTAIIIGPNHSGWGPDIASDTHHFWETPFGHVELDKQFAEAAGLKASEEAHEIEHSIEVIVPMLQYFFPKGFKILPIVIWNQSPEAARDLAIQLLAANKKLGRKVLVIASTDFSHYVSKDFGVKQDDKALEKIINMDINGLAQVINQEDISICGYGPIMTLMALAKLLYASPACKILSRGNSGQVIPSDEVVHYVSALVYNQPA